MLRISYHARKGERKRIRRRERVCNGWFFSDSIVVKVLVACMQGGRRTVIEVKRSI